GGKGQYPCHEFFQVCLLSLYFFRLGGTAGQPLRPIGHLLYFGAEYKDPVPWTKPKSFLGILLHPISHSGWYAPRHIKRKDSFFVLGLFGDGLGVGKSQD